MKPVPRTGALALAGLTVLSMAVLSSSDRIGVAGLAQAASAPGPFGDGVDLRPAPRLPADGARRLKRSLAAAAARRRAAHPFFPVAGSFNWGQGGARFGAGRSGHSHEGQDVFARTGTPLVAVSDGVVVEDGNDGGRGNYVAIYDPRSDRTYVYLHMNRPGSVGTGARVRGGQRVGEVGCTGSCFGDHLHFEIRGGRGTQGPASDPLSSLERWAAASSSRPTLPPGGH